MNQPIEKGIIRLKDLPQEEILVGIKKEFKKKIFKHVKRKDVEKIGITSSQFYNFKDNEKITIKLLFKFCDYLTRKGFKEFSHSKTERNIGLMGTKRGDVYIKTPALPFNFNNKEGSYFISAILFDGGIDKQAKPHYGNIHLKQRRRIAKYVKKIFGKIESNEINPTRGPMIRFPKSIGLTLNACFGIGIGNKIYHNNKIPSFIFKLDEKLKKDFLKQTFDDEGSVSISKRMIRISGTINIKKKEFHKDFTKKYNLLNGIRKILGDIGIETNSLRFSKHISTKESGKRGNVYKHTFTFSITGIENLERFHKQIGFNLDYKMKRLENLLKNYKQRQLRKGEIHKIALKECKKITKGITIPFLAKKINRTYRQTVRIVRNFEKQKLIQQIKPSINIGGKRFPAIYKVIQDKGKFLI
ncbi:MAG: hypothetical protein CMH63_00305 [Nanoarchaeota archaeon]|nr:hypothetical protein [Nanoarchaeota archaeon]|tara:strand:+ start:13931 stop:15172 length:1242 start_codon:yes stop_codon:yes gene_type:complete